MKAILNINLISNELLKLLKNNNLLLSTAESASCGMLASFLGNISGISNVYRGGFIAYSVYFKQKLLKINKQIINKYGTISEKCAIAMAKKVCNLTKSNIGVSITGNAGPTAIENKNIGLFYVGICINKKIQVHKFELNPKLSRLQLRKDITQNCLFLLVNEIKKVFK